MRINPDLNDNEFHNYHTRQMFTTKTNPDLNPVPTRT